jgi:hypothetical protein
MIAKIPVFISYYLSSVADGMKERKHQLDIVVIAVTDGRERSEQMKRRGMSPKELPGISAILLCHSSTHYAIVISSFVYFFMGRATISCLYFQKDESIRIIEHVVIQCL